MSRRSTLRASDEDRERVAERLRRATAEGRLLASELEERLEATFAARTYGHLDAVVDDLPREVVPRRQRARMLVSPRPAHVVAVVLLLPVLASLLLAALVVFATMFSAWALLAAVAWVAFGYGRHHQRTRYQQALHRHSPPAYGRWPAGRAGGARPRPWI